RRKDRRTIEPRPAEPVDRPVLGSERRRAAIANQRVIANRTIYRFVSIAHPPPSEASRRVSEPLRRAWSALCRRIAGRPLHGPSVNFAPRARGVKPGRDATWEKTPA